MIEMNLQSRLLRSTIGAGVPLLTLAVLAVFASLGAWAAPASGSTVVGAQTGGTSNFGLNCGPMPPQQPCKQTATIQSVASAHQAPGGATVPAAGVITGWSMSHGTVMTQGGGSASTSSLTVNLRVIRGAGAAGIGAGTGPTESLPQAPGTYSFPARLSVKAGDRVGYDLSFAPNNLVVYAAVIGGPGDTTGFGGPWPDGSPPTWYYDPSLPPNFTNVYLPMNVTVEPDVDGDGYGDETQDGCPSNAASHGACPPPPDTTAPATTISKRPKKKSTKRKASFAFESSEQGSTFECALAGKGLDELLKQFHACASPRVYKDLKTGKYTFQVRATDTAGNTDASPATAKFKVVKKKKGGKGGKG